MSNTGFADLNLTIETLNAVTMMGFSELSPIQQQAIPAIMNGNDIIGQAQTGTGKTAAFAIPVIEKLDPHNHNIQALILCPTRELVIQVTKEFNKLMRFKEGLVATAIYGGQPIERQLKALNKGTQVVIGTPGRTMDHLRRGTIDVSSIQFVVLDEADEMLDMGFREDIEIILKDTPHTRQTIMISATMPLDIIKLTRLYQQNPLHIDVTDKKMHAPKIEQLYFEVKEKHKSELFVRLVDMRNIKLGLVFCNTKSQVDCLVELLKSRNYFADGLHGDMSQNQRDKVMYSFRKGTIDILVATDVAGRGIDVDNIEAVFNYDLPRDDEDYIHRIGRTARAGKSGVAITFISTSSQIHQLRKIERLNDIVVKKSVIPTIQEVQAARAIASKEKIQALLNSADLQPYISEVETLIDKENSALKVAAALLKLSMANTDAGYDQNIDFSNPIDHEEVTEKPAFKRHGRRRSHSNRGYSAKRSNVKRTDNNHTEAKNKNNKGNNKPFGKKFSTNNSKKRKFKGAR